MLKTAEAQNAAIFFDVISRNADLVIGTPSCHEAQHFVDSHAYFQGDVTWCVQKAKRRAKWKQLWLLADWKNFLFIFGSILALTLLVYTFTGFEKRPFDIWISAFTVVRVVSLVGSTLNPERNSARLLYSYFLHASFFFMSVFGAFLFAIITTPFNEHQISNFEEIVTANCRLAGEQEMKQFLVDRDMVNVAFLFFSPILQ